eukprot:907991-Rhodomonas_salina.1
MNCICNGLAIPFSGGNAEGSIVEAVDDSCSGGKWSTLDASPPDNGPDVAELLDDPVSGVFTVLSATMLGCTVLGISIDGVDEPTVLGRGVFSVDDPPTSPPMLPLALGVRTGARARVLAEESSGLMMLMDCIEDELSMVESGLHYAGSDTTIFML